MHGWLVDPTSPEYAVLSRTEDYDTSVNLLVEVDHLTKGRFGWNIVTSWKESASKAVRGKKSNIKWHFS